MIEFVTGIIDRMNLSPTMRKLALVAVAVAVVVGGGWMLVELYGGRDPAPSTTITINLPAAGAGSAGAPAEVTIGAAGIPAAAPAGAPARAAVATAPRQDAPREVAPSERVRNVSAGQAFPLCGVSAFDLSPWHAVPGAARQAMLRTSSPTPAAAAGRSFTRVLTVGVPEDLWPGCRVTLAAVEDGVVDSVSLREQFSARPGP